MPDLAAMLPASMRFQDSSLGVVIDPPLHRLGCLVSTPGGTAAPKSCHLVSSRGNRLDDAESPSVRGCHLPDTFRPCRSSRLRRFAPPCTLQVCCALLPIMGFAMFPVRPVVARGLTIPSAEAGRSDLDMRLASIRTRRCFCSTAFLSTMLRGSGSRSPGGSRSPSPSWRGSHSFLWDLSQWRSTLRSFPLVSSCSASIALFSRTPYLLPVPSGPGSGVVCGA